MGEGSFFDERAQLSLPVVEVAVGVVLVAAVVTTVAVGVPSPDTREPQLDAYASDAATVLATEPPRHQARTRLNEILRSPSAFTREKSALDRRMRRIVPDNLMYRVETPHGSVGFRKPAGVVTGRASVVTASGTVTVWVWYA